MEEPRERQFGEQRDLSKMLDARLSDSTLPPRDVHLVYAESLSKLLLCQPEVLGAGLSYALGYNHED